MNKQPIAHTIAADANISVYSDSTGGATFGPQLNPSTDNFSAITIPNQQNGAGYHRMPPSLYIFDRQQNVYQTNVYGHLYKVVPIDNGLFLTLNPAFNSGDSLSVGYAHIIINTERLQVYSLGNYRIYWRRFFEAKFDWFTVSPDYQTISIHHVLGTRGEKAELPCEVELDDDLQIGQILVKTEFIRQDDQYVEGETDIVEVLTVERLEGNNGVQRETLDNWQTYCRK